MIELIHVTKAFGTKKVIDDLSLKIPANKITVIMGGSGHGKSTIVKLILGFIIPELGGTAKAKGFFTEINLEPGIYGFFFKSGFLLCNIGSVVL